MIWNGLLDRYKEYLPISEETPMLSLHEGNTPLIHLENLSKKYGYEFYVKYEGLNPTGSFKDRGMVMAVAKAKESGATTVICASTGNTSAAAAAYAARAGMRSIVVIPNGKIAYGKLAQAVMYGAEIICIDGNFDQALNIVQELSSDGSMTLVNSVNPFRIEGQKTAAFEICEQLGQAPDILAIPVGNAGNITAYWKGFKEYSTRNNFTLPKMFGFQAEGASPIVNKRKFDNPETIATAIRIGNPASWKTAEEAIEQSNGIIDSVTDDEIISAYKELASSEGIFAEPASCASWAGIKKHLEKGTLGDSKKVVLVLTGNGLKDPNVAIEYSKVNPSVLSADKDKIKAYLQGEASNVR
ncbi:MAG: Threonine synthase [Bacillales bacterium]|jgi:threonine synthase|nr:Threonine synthase [Bacillales bacterium]